MKTIKLPASADMILVSLVPSFLLSQQLGEQLSHALITTGRWSEELFRGDRLPSLPFPISSEQDSEDTIVGVEN